jgi:hypothetical protein
MGFFGGGANPIDSLLFSTGRIRQFRVGAAGSYTRTSGAGSLAAIGNTGGFNIILNAGTSAAGNGKIGYFDPTVAQMTASLGKIDYSKRIRFSIGGMMNLNSTNSVIRIVFGGTGSAADAPAANADGLTIKGFGAEFALQSGVVQARLIGFNASYLTPTAYTTLTSGFGLASSDTRFFGLVLESDGTGNIYLYGAESSTAPNINIGTTPLLTLTGGPTNDTSTNRFGPEIQCVNHATVAPTGSPSAIFQSTFWMIDVQ